MAQTKEQKERKKIYDRERRLKHPEIYAEYARRTEERRKSNPRRYEIRREEGLKRNYGITLAQYNELLVSQNSNCAICGTNQKDLDKPLYVDHCHDSGGIRGLLCQKCNSAIGLLNDDSEVVLKAYKYLAQIQKVSNN